MDNYQSHEELIQNLIQTPTGKILRIRPKINFDEEYLLERWILRAKEKESLYVLENENLVRNLIRYYFCIDTCQYDLCKPIALLGQTGIGKTFLFKMLSLISTSFETKCFKNKSTLMSFSFNNIVSSFTIFGKYSSGGYDAIYEYIYKPIIVVDDLGSEPTMANNYGNQVNIMKLIFEERYLRGNITYFTSNLPMKVINEKYGERVNDRILEDTTIIEMTGTNWRIEKNNI